MATNKYIPGICNIGWAERQRRKWLMLGSALVTLLMCVLLVLSPQYDSWRWTVFFPAAVFGVCFQQWYYRFCIRLGFAGLYNFMEIGKSTPVETKEFVRKDRMKALQIVLVGILVGVAVTAGIYWLPS